DDKPLDLRGPLEDGVDLRVPVPLLDRELTDVAVAAADLDRLVRHLDGDLPRLELGHRTLRHRKAAGVAALPESPPDQPAGGLDLERHVGELEGDGLVLDDRPAELLALLGVPEREL